jgi:hypothetical protein
MSLEESNVLKSVCLCEREEGWLITQTITLFYYYVCLFLNENKYFYCEPLGSGIIFNLKMLK